TPLQALPVLPQVHDAHHEQTVMVKHLSEQYRLIVRLWSTPIRIEPGGIAVAIGNVTEQQAETLIGLLKIPRTVQQFSSPVNRLSRDLETLKGSISHEPGKLIRILLEPGTQ
ncbi:MAG: phosphoesterase PA-phosphatase, partial [Candidatus Thiodiazotropha sp. (ex Lucinoma annulata)]|nr:phosphoesterase PA-phosphatase [Candidatus Thiodiazotropha sp. (ex Lucinoma annulata)]